MDCNTCQNIKNNYSADMKSNQLACLFMFLMLNVAVAQQTNPPVVGSEGVSVEELRVKAEQGDATAQSNLGDFYRKGKGVQQDFAEAVKWYRKAAEQNDATAQCNL